MATPDLASSSFSSDIFRAFYVLLADSVAISEKAASLAREIMPDKTVESCISIVQDFNTYP